MVVIYVYDTDIEVKKTNRQCCSAESEGLRFDSFFSLSHAHDKTKNIFLYLKHDAADPS